MPPFLLEIVMAVYFSVGEQDIIRALQEEFEITYIEACDRVIGQKRQAAYAYSQIGHFDLAEQMLKEIEEWNSEIEQDFINRGRGKAKEVSKKIILPGE